MYVFKMHVILKIDSDIYTTNFETNCFHGDQSQSVNVLRSPQTHTRWFTRSCLNGSLKVVKSGTVTVIYAVYVQSLEFWRQNQ